MRRAIALFLLLPALSACGLFVSKETRALRRSPNYKVGYQDGCNSAYGPDANKRNDNTLTRDDALYASNPAYRSGWNRGIAACRAGSSGGGGAMPGASPNAGPIPDRNPGNGGLPIN